MVTGPWGSIATFLYSRIWNFSTVLTKNKFPGGKFLNLSTVDRDKIPKDLDSSECPSSHLGCFHFDKKLLIFQKLNYVTNFAIFWFSPPDGKWKHMTQNGPRGPQ